MSHFRMRGYYNDIYLSVFISFSDSLCIVSHEKGKNRIRMQFYNGSIEPPRLKLRCNTMLAHSVQYCKVQTIYKLLLFNQSISGMYHSYFEWQKLCTIYSEKLPPSTRKGWIFAFLRLLLPTYPNDDKNAHSNNITFDFRNSFSVRQSKCQSLVVLHPLG